MQTFLFTLACVLFGVFLAVGFGVLIFKSVLALWRWSKNKVIYNVRPWFTNFNR